MIPTWMIEELEREQRERERERRERPRIRRELPSGLGEASGQRRPEPSSVIVIDLTGR